jgi:hypothetical protein
VVGHSGLAPGHRELNNVEPFADLKNVFERLSDDYPASRLDELLPWNWTEPEAAA